MYNKVALKITDWFINKGIIDDSKKAICKYGFEVLISSLTYFLLFAITSIITNSVLPSVLFWLGLFFIRKVAGGHHAKSYTSCHILFEANHIVFIILLKVIPSTWYYYSSIGIFVFSILSILLFAPVDHINKPFIKNEYKRFRFLSLMYCIVLLTVLILCFINVIPSNEFLFAYSIGTLSATISLLCGKTNRFIERKRTWKTLLSSSKRQYLQSH